MLEGDTEVAFIRRTIDTVNKAVENGRDSHLIEVFLKLRRSMFCHCFPDGDVDRFVQEIRNAFGIKEALKESSACAHEDTEQHRTCTWCKTCGALWNTQCMPTKGWQIPQREKENNNGKIKREKSKNN